MSDRQIWQRCRTALECSPYLAKEKILIMYKKDHCWFVFSTVSATKDILIAIFGKSAIN